MNKAIWSIRFLPYTSERLPAGRLMSIPGMVEAAAMMPMYCSAAPKETANNGSTGLLDMVEEKMAPPPMMLKIQNTWVFIRINLLCG